MCFSLFVMFLERKLTAIISLGVPGSECISEMWRDDVPVDLVYRVVNLVLTGLRHTHSSQPVFARELLQVVGIFVLSLEQSLCGGHVQELGRVKVRHEYTHNER